MDGAPSGFGASNLSQYDEKNSLNLYALFEDFDYSFEDGEHRFVFPDSMPTSTQERIRALDEADMPRGRLGGL